MHVSVLADPPPIRRDAGRAASQPVQNAKWRNKCVECGRVRNTVIPIAECSCGSCAVESTYQTTR